MCSFAINKSATLVTESTFLASLTLGLPFENLQWSGRTAHEWMKSQIGANNICILYPTTSFDTLKQLKSKHLRLGALSKAADAFVSPVRVLLLQESEKYTSQSTWRAHRCDVLLSLSLIEMVINWAIYSSSSNVLVKRNFDSRRTWDTLMTHIDQVPVGYDAF